MGVLDRLRDQAEAALRQDLEASYPGIHDLMGKMSKERTNLVLERNQGYYTVGTLWQEIIKTYVRENIEAKLESLLNGLEAK